MATKVSVDNAGYTLVFWGRNQAVARYAPNGSFAGVRNPEMLARCSLLADGQGRVIGIEAMQWPIFTTLRAGGCNHSR